MMSYSELICIMPRIFHPVLRLKNYFVLIQLVCDYCGVAKTVLIWTLVILTLSEPVNATNLKNIGFFKDTKQLNL